MKKKNYDDESDDEFNVDEPEELQEHSDEEWAPQVCVLPAQLLRKSVLNISFMVVNWFQQKGANKRQSTGKRGAAKKKKKGSSEEEDDEEETPKTKKKPAAKPKTPAKGKAAASKGKGKAKEDEEDEEDLNEEEVEDEELDDEEVEEEEEDEEEENNTADGNAKPAKEFSVSIRGKDQLCDVIVYRNV